MTSLQSQFLSSKGKPVKIAGHKVVQMDRIPITSGSITIRFISGKTDRLQGVALKSQKGFIKLSNGHEEGRVNIWNEQDLPAIVRHEVSCPDGELRLWNIYKATNDEDRTRADAWTNNAGMVVQEISRSHRRYNCSDGIGEFSLNDLIFEIEAVS